MTDYQTPTRAPTSAFIEKTNASYPENTATLSIADQRAIYDRMCAAFDSPCLAGVTCRFAR